MLSFINNYNLNFWYHNLSNYYFDKNLIKYSEPAKLHITNNVKTKLVN